MLSTAAMAGAAAVHPWRTIGAWLAVLVLSLAVIVTLLGSGITTDAEVTADNESNRGYEAIRAHFAQPPVVNGWSSYAARSSPSTIPPSGASSSAP